MSGLDLGLTQEELREAVIARAAGRIAEYVEQGEDGGERVRDMVRKAIDACALKVVQDTVLPIVEGHIDAMILQRTNEWGEKTGEPITFTQHMVARAEAYLKEPVNYEGKSRDECRDGFGFSKATSTRIAHMVDKHLQYSIENAMKDALKNANSHIVGGINEAVKIKLAEVAAGLKVNVEVKR